MTTNTYKPILFSTEMVQAILAGRKTQTRRIIKLDTGQLIADTVEQISSNYFLFKKDNEPVAGRIPKYQIDDILWVRETFHIYTGSVQGSYAYIEGEEVKYPPHILQNGIKRCVDFKADFPYSGLKWKPSLFMPKEAARIFLKVTNVRCERLQDISEEDAIAEGIERYGPFGEFKGDPHPAGGMMIFRAYTKAARAFQDLWDSINGKKHPWESNPWVWVYDFERIEKPENFLS